MKPSTAASRSYQKARAARRAEDVRRLRGFAEGTPLEIGEAAAPSEFYFVSGPGADAPFTGRYQVVAAYVVGYAAAWRLCTRPA